MPYLYTIIACVLCMGIGFFLGMLYRHSAVCVIPDELKDDTKENDWLDESDPFGDELDMPNYRHGDYPPGHEKPTRKPIKLDVSSAYPSNTLEKVIANIQEHDRLHPEHGVGCACHDVHAGMIRRLYQGVDEKSKRNLMVVLGYVTRSP